MKWIFLIFGLFALLVVGSIVVLIVFVIRKSTKPRSPEFIANEKKQMAHRVAEKKKELAPWSEHSYADVTSAMMYFRKKTMSHYLRGTIYSPDRKPIVAFDRVERGMAANGYMFASTTDVDLYYDINVDVFRITYNGELLGNIDKPGNIRDASGQVIGHAKHPTKVSFNIGGALHFRQGDNKFPLKMNGRQLATIWVAPNYGEQPTSSLALIFNENNWGQPILDVHDTPTEEEEKWLLALAVLETGFHGHWLI